ncbi:hypothetical protein [Collimonas sp. OK242]|jgi:hypothetical protein|uniref:hypothetical protein n=1 Tax=Collimonas sp. OK242 TaxID=1798195 RepID=UPI00115FF541|nr:hypothetical protein [Collimonas sp. OK242]
MPAAGVRLFNCFGASRTKTRHKADRHFDRNVLQPVLTPVLAASTCGMHIADKHFSPLFHSFSSMRTIGVIKQ